ncbi:MAG: S8 family serine peptidase [Candidatus Krumholzibacteria bacterium]|nr:S8 family serine peptidase [Candidatus Krumholzibacteria bacterium]
MRRFAPVAVLLFSLASAVPVTVRSAAAGAPVNSSLRFLQAQRSGPPRAAAPGREILGSAGGETVTLTVKFDHILSVSEIAGYEARGISFFRIDGDVARTGTIYPLAAPWSEVEGLGQSREVLRIEAAWRPAVFPTLDVSRPQVGADSAWTVSDPLGCPIAGEGKRVADFDTGIDVFHPSFFNADGDTFDWYDLDTNGAFDPGMDYVDLNRNAAFDYGEVLRLRDGHILDYAAVWGGGTPANADNVYQTYWDWIYADLNYNYQRDFGPAAGYGDADPGFGEPIFIALDDNGNGVLDIGERLVQLGTSKIAATVGAGPTEYVRGVDLAYSEDDANGHGTAVMGIVAGGTRGRHRFCGIAPEAELLAGYFFSGVPISYLVPWARSHGADVMLYEFGGFVFDFLDGSSLDEELIALENETIIQITPSGNLARGNKHAIATVPAGGGAALPVTASPYGGDLSALWWTTLWTTSIGDLSFTLQSPLGGSIALSGGDQYVNAFYVWSDTDTSPRGTCKLDIYIDRNTNVSVNGQWRLAVANATGSAIEVISNVADDLSSWAGGAEFTGYATNDRNVTWPATADSAFCNGSYSTRGFEGYGGVGGGSIPAGELSAFSGRGARIDGKHLLDIVSPGNYDVYSTMSHTTSNNYPLGSYRQFSGTSAAGPHVAAAAALVQQAFPGASMHEVEWLLASHALADGFTGAVYNDWWGYGKLRILGAIGVWTDVEEMADGRMAPRLLLDRNWPNPFNPVTWIPFYLPRDGQASVRIYDARGGLIRTIRDTWMNGGAHSVLWDGTDSRGRGVASGVYFCVLSQGGEKQTRKLVLLR